MEKEANLPLCVNGIIKTVRFSCKFRTFSETSSRIYGHITQVIEFL